MDSISTAKSSSSSFFMIIKPTSNPSFPVLKKQQIHFPSNHLLMKKLTIIKASSDSSSSSSSSSNFPTPKTNNFISTLKTTAIAVVFLSALFWTFKHLSGKLISLPAKFFEQCISETIGAMKTAYSESSRVDLQPELQLKLNPKAIFDLRTLLSRKIMADKKKECLGILLKLSSAQPKIRSWKFLAARLLNELGNTQEAIEVLLPIIFSDEIPCLLAMMEISLLVDLSAFEELVKSIEEENRESLKHISDKGKQGYEERLYGAQLQFLLNDVDKALRSYEELERDNPNDFRPYFCKGVIYDLIGKRKEAREQFAMFRKLYPEKIWVEWYLRTPIRRTRLFLTSKKKK